MISGKRVLLGWAGVLMASAGSVPTVVQAQQLPTCAALAAQLLTAEDISAATSVLVPAIAPHKTYCKVNITVSALSGEKDGYLPGQSQHVKVGICLPLSSIDGGSGGTQGRCQPLHQDRWRCRRIGRAMNCITNPAAWLRGD